MKNLYIVFIEKETKEHNEKFVEHLSSKGYGYYHWFENAWIIDTETSSYVTVELRDYLKVLYECKILVINIGPSVIGWQAVGSEKMAEWLRKYLKP